MDPLATALTPWNAARARVRFVVNTAADCVYGAFARRLPLQVATTHPMQYLLSQPKRVRGSSARVPPRALVITIDGADHDFGGLHAAFVRARRDLPFALVTPFVVSNGRRWKPSDYPYTASVLSTATADPLAFDVAGVSAIIRDINDRCGTELPVYITGFSAGGHLAWLLLLTHADWLAGATLASANFAGRGLTSDPRTGSATPVPVRAFFGAADKVFDALRGQWERGRALAQQRGCRDLTHTVVPGAGHSPFAREVLEYFAMLALSI
jgi:poly(3-hydroxybutyrate) depolymerase